MARDFVIDRMPCTVKLLPATKGSTRFYDFDEYERLVDAARRLDSRTHLVVLLGGEAGLRCGEMIALEMWIWRTASSASGSPIGTAK